MDYQRCWDVACQLPNLRPQLDAVVEGALVSLNREQLSRLEASRLVPALYRWRSVSVLGPWGRRRRALLLWNPQGDGGGVPCSSVWQEVVLGALQHGLSDAAIEALLALRPNDWPLVERRWQRPLPVLPLTSPPAPEAWDAA